MKNINIAFSGKSLRAFTDETVTTEDIVDGSILLIELALLKGKPGAGDREDSQKKVLDYFTVKLNDLIKFYKQ